MTIQEDNINNLPHANIPKIVKDDGSLNLAQIESNSYNGEQMQLTAEQQALIDQISTQDLEGMSTEELQQYSDSLSNAAEIVNKESDDT